MNLPYASPEPCSLKTVPYKNLTHPDSCDVSGQTIAGFDPADTSGLTNG